MDITGWLRSLGLERYEQAFHENDVDAEVLPELTADDLHGVMLGAERDHNGWVLRALALVNRRRIGQHQLIKPARADVTLQC